MTDNPNLSQFLDRLEKLSDETRTEAKNKRHKLGLRTARENLDHLVDDQSFLEYGAFAVAAQRNRRKYEDLQIDTAADGIITCLLYTSPSPRDGRISRMPSSA